MADMDLQIKISATVEQAVAQMQEIGKSLKEIYINGGLAALGIAAMERSAGGIGKISAALDQASKKLKKFGRDFTQNITLPVAGLAALSLKKVFDEAVIGQGTRATNGFAASVQNLKLNFDQLLKVIGEDLAPIATKVANFFNAMITAYRELEPGTKALINGFSLFAAAIGPILLALSAFFGIVSKLLFVLKPLVAEIGLFAQSFSAVYFAVAALVVSVAGLSKIFFDLRSTGETVGQALEDVFFLAGSAIGKYVGGTILGFIAKIANGLGGLLSFVNKDLGDGFKFFAATLQTTVDGIDKSFDQSLGTVNAKLATIGTSAGNSFSFGFVNGLKGLKDKIADATGGDSSGKSPRLSQEELKRLIDNKYINTQIEQLRKEHNNTLENIDKQHQQAMSSIDSSSDPIKLVQAKFEAEKEFILKKQELENQALAQAQQRDLAIAQSLDNVNQRKRAVELANTQGYLDKVKLTNAQELELTNANNAAIQESYRARYEQTKQYADVFADGFTSSLIEIAEGTETFSRSLEKFAANFIKQIAAMILKALIFKTIMDALGLAAPGGAGIKTPKGGQTPTQFKASGGYITGPGSGTSDSIPARLSNGEFVTDAKTVSRFGVDFFHNLKRMAKGGVTTRSRGSIPGFADGGLVSSASNAPQVVIQNSGTPKEATSTSFDASTAVTTVILDDLGKNGSISKSLQRNFGVRRSNFK